MSLKTRPGALFSQEKLKALRQEAELRGVSMGELVRDAVSRTYPKPSERARRKALKFLTSGPVVDVGTWDEAKKLIGRYVDKEP